MKQLPRLIWPAALLVAAWLAPNATITLTLIGVAILFALLSWFRSPQADPAIWRLQRQLGIAAIGGELLISLAVVTNNLDVTIARNYALLTLVAAAPVGVELLLRISRQQPGRVALLGHAAVDAAALLTILALSFAGSLLLDIPPALSVMQVLIITLLVRPLIVTLSLASAPAERRWQVLFTALAVYGSYLFFFIRHYLEPVHADSTNPITWQATTTALLVFVLCQLALLLIQRRPSKATMHRCIALIGLLLLMIYVSPLQNLLATNGLTAADWLWAIIGGLFYLSLYLLQRQSALHSRREVLALHRRLD